MNLVDPSIEVNLDKNAEVSIKILLENHPLIENVELPSDDITIYLNDNVIKPEEYFKPIKNLVDFDKKNENNKVPVQIRIVYTLDRQNGIVDRINKINHQLKLTFIQNKNQREDLISLGKKLIQNKDKLLDKFKSMLRSTKKYDDLYESMKNGTLLMDVSKEKLFSHILDCFEQLSKKDEKDYCSSSHIISYQMGSLLKRLMQAVDIKVSDSQQSEIDIRYFYNQIRISTILNRIVDELVGDVLVFIYKYGPLFYPCKDAISTINLAYNILVGEIVKQLIEQMNFYLEKLSYNSLDIVKKINGLVYSDFYFERMTRTLTEKVKDFPTDSINLIELNIPKTTYEKICSIEKMNGDWDNFIRMSVEPGTLQTPENTMIYLSKFYTHIIERNMRIYEYYGVVFENLLNLSSFFN